MNVEYECRMSIDECRIKEFFLFYLLKLAERIDTTVSDKPHSALAFLQLGLAG
jgi:hypothetical protein